VGKFRKFKDPFEGFLKWAVYLAHSKVQLFRIQGVVQVCC
jgi:hypothetical protein